MNFNHTNKDIKDFYQYKFNFKHQYKKLMFLSEISLYYLQ